MLCLGVDPRRWLYPPPHTHPLCPADDLWGETLSIPGGLSTLQPLGEGQLPATPGQELDPRLILFPLLLKLLTARQASGPGV